MVDAENVQTVDLLIDNATIFTLDGGRRIIEDGSIAIEGSRIIDIGKSSALKGKYYPLKIIPGKNRLVMPGLINGHSHLIELAKGLVPDDLKTRDALMLWIYPYMSKLTKEEEHAHALNFIAEMVKSGTTCFVDPGVQFLDSTIKAILQFLLDEPSMGLAPILVRSVFDIIHEISEQGTSILLIEQNAKIALKVSDFGYVLETGSMILFGKSKDLLQDDSVRKAYLGR